MSNGVRISADTANSAVGADLAERLSAKVTTGAADIALVSAPPTEPATHVVVTGGISEAVDEWDRAVAPQTVAGALWITSGQDAALAAAAWWVLRNQTPTTPLSDLTDTNERCLRWSVLGVTVVALTEPGEVTVDHEKIRAELDEAPEIQDLGKAIDRIGGDTADQVLASVLAHEPLPGAVEIPAATPGVVRSSAIGATVGGGTMAFYGLLFGPLGLAIAAGVGALSGGLLMGGIEYRRKRTAGRVLVLTPDAFVGGLDGQRVRAFAWAEVGRFIEGIDPLGSPALEVVGIDGGMLARVPARYFGAPLHVIVAVAEAYRSRTTPT
ncbi:MAG: hypothetical protein KC619_17410 [Myxococcales bacterium]|nr:hypothetical protein [Myxococcales bacterium]